MEKRGQHTGTNHWTVGKISKGAQPTVFIYMIAKAICHMAKSRRIVNIKKAGSLCPLSFVCHLGCHPSVTSGVICLVCIIVFYCVQAKIRVSLVCHFGCHFAFACNRMQMLTSTCVRILVWTEAKSGQLVGRPLCPFIRLCAVPWWPLYGSLRRFQACAVWCAYHPAGRPCHWPYPASRQYLCTALQ